MLFDYFYGVEADQYNFYPVTEIVNDTERIL